MRFTQPLNHLPPVDRALQRIWSIQENLTVFSLEASWQADFHHLALQIVEPFEQPFNLGHSHHFSFFNSVTHMSHWDVLHMQKMYIYVTKPNIAKCLYRAYHECRRQITGSSLKASCKVNHLLHLYLMKDSLSYSPISCLWYIKVMFDLNMAL